jgi:hypothetical protein
MKDDYFYKKSHLANRTDKELGEQVQTTLKMAEFIEDLMEKAASCGNKSEPFSERYMSRISTMLDKIYIKYYDPELF